MSLPLHPFLLFSYVVILIAGKNQHYLPLGELLLYLVIGNLIVWAVYRAFRIVSANRQDCALAATLVVVALTQFRNACILFGIPHASSGIENSTVAFAAVWVLGAGVLIYLLLRSNISGKALTPGLNIFAIALILFNIAPVVRYQISRMDYTGAAAQWRARSAQPLPGGMKEKPDVYYLVFDRYPSADVLRDNYKFDNSAFLQRLEQRGFFVVPRARANYLKTAHSLASTLHMQYLDPLASIAGPDKVDWQPLYAALRDNPVFNTFRKNGYALYHMGSWWDATRVHPDAVANINGDTLPQLLNVFVVNSPVLALAKYFPKLSRRHHQWLRIHAKFDALESLPAQPGPKFVFAHFLVPHPPCVVNAEGDFVGIDERRGMQLNEAFLLQLQYANRRILRFIDRAMDAKREAVIILQADEGPFPERYRRNTVYFDWTEAEDAELRMKTGILNAYHLTPDAQKQLYAGITPVNSFRIVLSDLLDSELPLLEDKVFLFRSELDLYTLEEVTERVR